MNTANIDLALIRTMIRDEREVPAQWQLTSQPSEKPEASEEKAAVQMNAAKLKLIDEISRLIMELKTQFPELAKNLSKVRDYVSVTQENIPAKHLANLLSAIQQNLNCFTDKSAETIKSTASEIMRILPRNAEIPQENKLILALAKNDLITASIAIKNIVENNAPASTPTNAPASTPTNAPASTPTNAPASIPINAPASIPINAPASTPINAPASIPINAPALQIIFNALQELKELGIPREFQSVPLKELEAIAIQKTGIEIPKDAAKVLSVVFSEKPVFATVNYKPEAISISYPVPDFTPKSNAAPVSVTARVENLEIPLPKEQGQARGSVTARIEDIVIPLPKEQAQTRSSVTARIEDIVIPLPKEQGQARSSVTARIEDIVIPLPKEQAQTRNSVTARIEDIVIPLPKEQAQTRNSVTARVENLEIPLPKEQAQARSYAPVHSSSVSVPVRFENVEIPLPKDYPLEKIFPTATPTSTIALSLYQLAAPQPQIHNPTPAPLPPEPSSHFFLQPWPASAQIPKEERDFWLRTELPLTPQTLNIREVILSFGKLPENPEPVRLFTGAMHELSLQTENGKPVTKEQADLLWRVINSQPPTPNSQLTSPQLTKIISSGFLKYQPIGNYEVDLFKNLPEPVKKELLRELPAGKAWQPEVLQKAVEKVLDKYVEQQPSITHEHAKKTNEEVRQVLQSFKEQIQWTRIDQDTKPPTDRENVFYFMHEGDLQKGRLKIKDQRGGGKKQQDSSISFTIETKTKNLGNVHADLTLSKNILNIRLQDEIGTANNAVAEERETLSKELADIGITLGELLYGKTPKVQAIPIVEKKGKTGMLDVKA